MNKIKINVTQGLDGINYTLLPNERKKVKDLMPKSKPVRKLFIGYDNYNDLGLSYGKVEKLLLPVLLGIDLESLLKKISQIIFVNSDSNKTIFKIPS